MTAHPILDAENVTRIFGGVKAVHGVDLRLDADTKEKSGTITALIGPNGAGKSTFFNILGGQLRPDTGRIRFFGQDATGAAPRRIHRLGVARTFQITATFGSMTAAENVQTALIANDRKHFSLFRRADHYRRADALHLLERVGIVDFADTLCSELAYGDLKRVEMAIALSSEPRLLLMDEPTAGMAPAERHALMELVAGIAASDGTAVLFTEHDMDIVFNHASRVVVLDRGRIIADGTPDAVRANTRVSEVYLGRETTR